MDPDDLSGESSWLRRQARRAIGSRLRRFVDSADLAQEAHLAAQRGMNGKSFPNRGAFRAWLLVILNRLAIHEARRDRGIEVLEGGSQHSMRCETPSHGLAQHEASHRLRARIEGLPARERRVVLMRVVEDAPFARIAESLAISEGNARIVFHRAMKRLREGAVGRELDRD